MPRSRVAIWLSRRAVVDPFLSTEGRTAEFAVLEGEREIPGGQSFVRTSRREFNDQRIRTTGRRSIGRSLRTPRNLPLSFSNSCQISLC
jgi:hypothetical protein